MHKANEGKKSKKSTHKDTKRSKYPTKKDDLSLEINTAKLVRAFFDFSAERFN